MAIALQECKLAQAIALELLLAIVMLQLVGRAPQLHLAAELAHSLDKLPPLPPLVVLQLVQLLLGKRKQRELLAKDLQQEVKAQLLEHKSQPPGARVQLLEPKAQLEAHQILKV